MRNTKLINISGIVIILVLVIFAVGYLLATNWKAASNSQTVAQNSNQATNDENPFTKQNTPDDIRVFRAHGVTSMEVLEIIARLVLSVILAAVLAFRPRKNVPLFRRNLYVAQTQILLAVVAAALMMIVGDNTARAFAIFAAVSLVRFRTNIKDPKEITVLLISLALGLATGVGRWDLGLILCVFALVLLWFLEYREPEQVTRSMQLTVKTRNMDSTLDALKKIFDSYKLDSEVRKIEPPEEDDSIGCVTYYMNLRLNLSTDSLSETIFEADPNNIDGIQWEQKKDASYIYQ